MVVSSHSSRPKPGRWTILTTWAVVTITLSACQGAVSPTEPSSKFIGLEFDAVVSAVSGHAQSGVPGETLSEPLVVKVTDPSGEPMAGVQVSWAVTEAGGAVVPVGQTTNREGHASAVWTLGEKTGTPMASAIVEGAGNAVFAALVRPDALLAPPAPTDSVAPADSVPPADSGAAPTDTVAPPADSVATPADSVANVPPADSVAPAPPAPPITPSVPPVLPSGLIPAFPGAEGWGATALNECRELPLVVHQVTNTNSSGRGSFRDIIENRLSANAFDVVVFRTGGLIDLNRAAGTVFSRNKHCVYIAGQTAPGGGISLIGQSVEFRDANDVVVRHIRHRGQNPGTALMHRGGFRVVYADISGSWSVGRFIIRLTGGDNFPMGDATVQNTLLYEPDAAHATHLGLVANNDVDAPLYRVSAHRNAMLGPGRRMPLCQGFDVSVVNNVMYNWQQRATEANNTGVCDFVANYYKPGPTTLSSSQRYSQRPFLIWDTCSKGRPDDCTKSYYIAENRSSASNWVAAGGTTPWEGSRREISCGEGSSKGSWCTQDDGPVDSRMRRFTPVPAATPFRVNQRAITDALVEDIVSTAGHSRRVTCNGSWAGVRDSVDAQRVQWFRSGTGFNQNVYAADMDVPVPASGTPCRDADGDALPDEWEQRYFGCVTCAEPATVGRNGYLLIEHYVNGTDPR